MELNSHFHSHFNSHFNSSTRYWFTRVQPLGMPLTLLVGHSALAAARKVLVPVTLLPAFSSQ